MKWWAVKIPFKGYAEEEESMKWWAVKIPIKGYAEIDVEADTLEAENKKLRDVLQMLTSNPEEVYMGYTRIQFSKRLLPERAQEILDLAWPKGEKG